MQKNILYTIPLIAWVLLVPSCTRFLDVKPVGKLIPTQVQELEKLLNNRNTLDYHFMENNAGSYYALLADNFKISENQARYLFVNTNPNVNRYAAYTFYLPYENPELPGRTWEFGIYKAVGLFNVVIEGINDIAGGAESDLGKSVMAQAKAGRAWSMLVGTLGFGPMYDPNGSNDKRVIPYRTAAMPTEPNPDLSTTAELLDRVEQDLHDALDAPDQVVNPTRANRAAVHAILAQLYMYKRDWPKMLASAQEAWNRALAIKGGVDNLIYDLNAFSYRPDPNASPAPGTDVEVGLELQGPDMLFKQSDNRENLFYRISPPGTAHYPSDDFVDLFDKNTDRRYQLFMLKTLGYSTTVAGVKYDDGVVFNYFRDAKMLGNEGITYPELLLMKAEANARLNNLGDALADLNLLRQYRYTGSNTDLPNGASLNQDDLLYAILQERRRELPIGSFQRTFDIKRYTLDRGKPWSQTQITHYVGTKAYTAEVNDQYYNMKVPNNIIRLNPQWGLTPWEGPYDPASH